MRKKDLKFGNVVENRRGDRYLFFALDKKDLINLCGLGFVELDSYNDELNCQSTILSTLNLDIVKVYEDYTCKKLLWERKEKPVLTDDEKVILRNIDKAFKYIARDRGDSLFVYTSKPIKKRNDWKFNYIDENLKDEWSAITIYNHLFQFIRWDDKEPYLIEDLLK